MSAFFAVFDSQLQDFEWIGEAPSAASAIAALISEDDYNPEEFRGVRVYEVDQAQVDALIGWWGGGGAKAKFPAGLPASLVFSEADIAGIFEHRSTLSKGAIRF